MTKKTKENYVEIAAQAIVALSATDYSSRDDNVAQALFAIAKRVVEIDRERQHDVRDERYYIRDLLRAAGME